MKTFEVPVWFKIKGHDQQDAWQKVVRLMKQLEQQDQLPDFIVEQPHELLTGDKAWR